MNVVSVSDESIENYDLNDCGVNIFEAFVSHAQLLILFPRTIMINNGKIKKKTQNSKDKKKKVEKKRKMEKRVWQHCRDDTIEDIDFSQKERIPLSVQGYTWC